MGEIQNYLSVVEVLDQGREDLYFWEVKIAEVDQDIYFSIFSKQLDVNISWQKSEYETIEETEFWLSEYCHIKTISIIKGEVHD